PTPPQFCATLLLPRPPLPPPPPLFPYTTLFRSINDSSHQASSRSVRPTNGSSARRSKHSFVIADARLIASSSPGSFTARTPWTRDRKSTRLNSSHQIISYAVFCLKKKNSKRNHQ